MTVCRSLSWREVAAKYRPRVGRMLVMHTKYTIHYICVSQHHLFSAHLFRMPSAWAFFPVLPVALTKSSIERNERKLLLLVLLFQPEAPKNNNPAKIKKRMCLRHWATLLRILQCFGKAPATETLGRQRGGSLCRIPEP